MPVSHTLLRGLYSRVVGIFALTAVLFGLTLAQGTRSAFAVPAGAVPGAAVPAALLPADGSHGATAIAATSGSKSVRLSPADSPETSDTSITLPPTPAGFESARNAWLQIDAAPAARHWIVPLLKEAEAFKAEVNARLGVAGLDRVVVRVAEDSHAMLELAPRGAPYPEYAEGVAYSRLGLILLTAVPENSAQEFDLLTTFRHELAHVALYDALSHHSVPLWFNEGLAIHLSRENSFARSQALFSASMSGNLLPLSQIDQRFPRDIVGVPLAYAESADVVRFLLRTQDQERFRLLIKRIGRGQGFESALSDSYGMDLYNLESTWLEDVKSRNTLWPVLFSGTALWGFGLVLITLAWRRKRERQKLVMQRWEREEAIEAERARAALLARMELESEPPTPIWSDAPPPPKSLPSPQQPSASPSSMPAALPGSLSSSSPRSGQRDSVPRVQHEGDWHTLH